jgi:hypothetical protein
MSDEQQAAAVGRIVEEYREAKVKLSALRSEAENLAKRLRAAADAVNPPTSSPGSAHPFPGAAAIGWRRRCGRSRWVRRAVR